MSKPTIEKLNVDSPEARSADLVQENIARLRELFPSAFNEDGVDFDVLKQLLGGQPPEHEERFGLNWFGKRRARQLALLPSMGTLLPRPTESTDWDNTKNIFIEGDNLEVLKLMQKSYSGSVKLIYIDPPYNTGSDFLYPDNFRDGMRNYLSITGQVDGGVRMTSNPESSGRFHTDWLNMMYPRLSLARNLLSSSGLLFMSCDDNEIENARLMLSEIFGEDNFFGQIIVQSNKRGQTYNDISKTHEYLIVYGKSSESSIFELSKDDKSLPFEDSRGRFDLWELRNRNPKFGRHNRPNLYYPFYVAPGKVDENGYSLISLDRTDEFVEEVFPRNSEGKDGCWRWGKDKVRSVDCKSGTAVIVAKQKRDGQWNIYEKSRKSTTKPKSIWDDVSVINEQGTIALGDLGLSGAFDHPKPIGLLKKIISISTERDDIILDFFAGSGTTAHAAMELASEEGENRSFILVQLPEVLDPSNPGQKTAADYCSSLGLASTIAELTKERLRRAGAKLRAENPMFSGDTGFRVFKLAASNIKAWEPNRDDITESLLEHRDHLISGRCEQDVIYELLLKLGLDLRTPIELREIDGKALYSIGGGALFACLADGLSQEFIEPICMGIVHWVDELAPAAEVRVVFKDAGFPNDVVKANMAAILNQNGISDIRSL